jgi:hypothetical protein
MAKDIQRNDVSIKEEKLLLHHKRCGCDAKIFVSLEMD